MIYDEAFIDRLTVSPQVSGMPGVFQICRDRLDAGAWRKVVEEYYRNLEPDDQAKFLKPLRSANDELFYGALFELLVGRAFELLGCSVRHDPLIGNKTPDMLVATDQGHFVCEVASLLQDSELRERMKAARALHRGLNRLVTTNHHIAIQYHNWPVVTDIRPLAERLQVLVSQHVDTQLNERISMPGFHARMFGVPSTTGRRGGITAWGWPCVADNPVGRAKGVLRKKASRYRNTGGRPLILALCDPAITGSSLSPDVVEDALYGHSVSCAHQRPLTTPNSFFGSQQSHVTGVLIAKWALVPTALELTFYANPLAHCLPPQEIFAGLPRLLSKRNPAGPVGMEWHDKGAGVLLLD